MGFVAEGVIDPELNDIGSAFDIVRAFLGPAMPQKMKGRGVLHANEAHLVAGVFNLARLHKYTKRDARNFPWTPGHGQLKQEVQALGVGVL